MVRQHFSQPSEVRRGFVKRNEPARVFLRDLQDLQLRLKYEFKNLELLKQALTHRSFSQDHYERLEFLGDAALGLSISAFLFERLGAQMAEGDLSRVRARLVREASLHTLALDLGLPALLRLGAGEVGTGGAVRASILADAVEAILGAIYLDGGFEACFQTVRHLFSKIDINSDFIASAKDAKTRLQEFLQAGKWPTPEYAVLKTTGAEHQQVFHVQCRVPSHALQCEAEGQNRRSAEQAAAQKMLQLLAENTKPKTAVRTVGKKSQR